MFFPRGDMSKVRGAVTTASGVVEGMEGAGGTAIQAFGARNSSRVVSFAV